MTDHQHRTHDKGFAARIWQSLLATSEAAVDIHYRAPWQRTPSPAGERGAGLLKR